MRPNVLPMAMIDLHSHVLPGIDDGPADLEGSLAIARRAFQGGIRTLLATPHASTRYPNDPGTIAPALAAVRSLLQDEEIPLELLGGAEIAVTHISEMDPADIAEMTLGGGGWLLIEPPFSPVATGLETNIRALLREGYSVLLAHPERCPAIHRDPEIVERLVAAGVATSVTAGSLGGRFGSASRRLASELLEAGLAHNVASDAHDESNRPPSLAPQIESAGFGQLAEWLTEEVPQAILGGDPLPERPTMRRSPRRRLLQRLGL
jgi:protein-tyrosine phosphatase